MDLFFYFPFKFQNDVVEARFSDRFEKIPALLFHGRCGPFDFIDQTLWVAVKIEPDGPFGPFLHGYQSCRFSSSIAFAGSAGRFLAISLSAASVSSGMCGSPFARLSSAKAAQVKLNATVFFLI